MSKTCNILYLVCLCLSTTGLSGISPANSQELDDETLTVGEQTGPPQQDRIRLPDTNHGIASFPQQRPNIAALPSQTGNPARVENDPFSGPGFRIGTLRGAIELEEQIGHSTNVSNVPRGEAGFFSRTSASLSLTSDWQRHQLQVIADGSSRNPFDTDQQDSLEANATIALRMDLRDGITLTPQLAYSVASQSFSSVASTTGVSEQPLIHTGVGSLTLERDIGMFATTLRGEITRDRYEDAQFGNGTSIDNGDLDNIEYGITGRLGYNLSEAVVPFVEGRLAWREFDRETDRIGVNRNAQITELGLGVELDYSEKLNGEISIGYVTESFEEAGLEDLSGLTFASSLNWSPQRETTASFDLTTRTNPSFAGGSSGSILYNGRLSVARNLTERLTATGFAGLEFETGDQGSTTAELGFGAQYRLSRALSVTADLEYTDFDSKLADSDFTDLSALLGLKWQR